jgi:dienelactone hydrolase/membrane-associated phospholipid phosphatase
MNKIAKVISIIGHPLMFIPAVTGLILILLEGVKTGLQSFGILIGLAILPITIWMFVKSKSGFYTNFDVSNRRQRVTLFLFIILFLLVTTLTLYITGQPKYLCFSLLIGTGLITISFFVNYIIKSSLHVSLNAYLAICIGIINIPLSIGLFLFTLIIGWSRIVLKRHSILEVCIGLVLGVISGFGFIKSQNNQIDTQQKQLLNSDFKSCILKNEVSNSKAILEIFPKESFLDEPLKIEVSKLAPFQVAAIKVMVIDGNGTYWESRACYKANELGQINPSKQEPLNNSSYTGIHAMGLFWSLTSEKLDVFNYKDNLDFVINLETGNSTQSDTIKRKTYSNLNAFNIEKIEIRNELVGNLYLQKDHKKRPVIILLGGSGGNFQNGKAAYLATKGYAVFDLKYFGAKNLPKHLERIPLEYLEKAINYLKNHPNIDSSRIALIGRSKGAEFALLYASLHEDINAVISVVGSSVSWSSKNYFSPSWTYKNKDIPFARGSIIEAVKYLRKSNDLSQDQSSYMLSAFKNENKIRKASIKIENIKCPILLLSGKSDLQWSSTMMSDLIVSRANNHNFPFEINHYSYDNAGHQFDEIPYIPLVDFSKVVTWKSGGTPQGNALAAIDSWKKILTFLEKNLTKEK